MTGNPKFFLGSDSAPHARSTKECSVGCAGVFTSPYILPYLATSFEQMNCLDKLQGFVSDFGCKFYQCSPCSTVVDLVREPLSVASEFPYGKDGQSVVPYKYSEQLSWRIGGFR